MKRLFAVLFISTIVWAQSPEALDNDMIVKMVQSGVPALVIISTIANPQHVNFRFLPSDLQIFEAAKVPDHVFKAMAAKDRGQPIPGLQPTAPAAPALAPASPAQVGSPLPGQATPGVSKSRDRDQDTDDSPSLRLGHVEILGFGGVNGSSGRSPLNAVSYSARRRGRGDNALAFDP